MSAMKLISDLIKHPLPEEEEDKIMEKLIVMNENDELRTKWNKSLSENTISQVPIEDKRFFSVRRIMTLAAGFLILVTAGILLWPSSTDSTDLFRDAMSETVAYHPGSAKGESDSSVRSKAITAFNEKKYAEAKTLFSAIGNTSEADAFYLALSHIYLSETQEALDIFKQFDEKSMYNEEISWYTALAYGISGNNDRATEILNNISQGDYKYIESKSLIEKLK